MSLYKGLIDNTVPFSGLNKDVCFIILRKEKGLSDPGRASFAKKSKFVNDVGQSSYVALFSYIDYTALSLPPPLPLSHFLLHFSRLSFIPVLREQN